MARDVPVNHPVLGICRVSHYPVLLGLGKIIYLSKFNFFQSKILNRIVQSRPVNAPISGALPALERINRTARKLGWRRLSIANPTCDNGLQPLPKSFQKRRESQLEPS